MCDSVDHFLQHNNAEASRGVYFCIALVNMCLYFGMHIIIKYYLLHVYRNKRANNQVFLVTTAERVEEVIADADHSGDWIHRLASIAIIDENQIGKWYHGVPVVATYDNMFQYVKEQIVDEVLSVCRMRQEIRLRRWSTVLRIWGQPYMSRLRS